MSEDKKTHIATIAILVKERGTNIAEVNEILSKHADRIVSRLGVNLDRLGADGYGGLIDVVVFASIDEIRSLESELDALYGIVARAGILD